MAGFADTMKGLAGNKLFLQYLAGAGSDILAGEPIGRNVNVVTQQNIQAQNMMKLLGQMIGGGGKVTVDKDNISIKAPTAALPGKSRTPTLLDEGDLDLGSIQAGTTGVPDLLSQYLGGGTAGPTPFR